MPTALAISSSAGAKARAHDDGRVSPDGEDLTGKLLTRHFRHLDISARTRTEVYRKGGAEVAGKSGVTALFIEPGSPWENGYIESFSMRLRDGLLNGEIFTTLLEAKVLIESWRREYNTIRPHSALGYKPPAPEAVISSRMGGSLTLKVVQ
jgi:hypothetical protein